MTARLGIRPRMTRRPFLLVPIVVVALTTVGVSIAVAARPKPPTIVRHANVRAEATGPTGAKVTYRPAKVIGAKSVTYSRRSGALFPLGKTIVKITARNSGGTTRSTFAVLVVDTTPPVLVSPSNVSTKATGPSGTNVTYGPIAATDRVDQDVSVTCSPPSGSMFAPGTTNVVCRARDDAGNVATATFKVVVAANAPPVFPNPMFVQATTSFQYDANGRLAGATTTITVSPATDPDGDALSYAWAATNGSISGNGVTATWTRMIQSGQPARGSVTVTASDGSGGSDTFTIQFT